MEPGDIVWHRVFSEPVLLVSKWDDKNVRVYWECLINGELELFTEDELIKPEEEDESR